MACQLLRRPAVRLDPRRAANSSAHWIEENYERAAQARPRGATPLDPPGSEKKQKQILRDHWSRYGRSTESLLEKSHPRSIITFLSGRPGDFCGAWGCVWAVRSLYLSAFQSYLGTRSSTASSASALPSRADRGSPPRDQPTRLPRLTDEQRQEFQEMLIPLPSGRTRLDGHPRARRDPRRPDGHGAHAGSADRGQAPPRQLLLQRRAGRPSSSSRG